MPARTLAQWLKWQEQLHPNAIELGLERVAAVHARMMLPRPASIVIIVGGTNGKGSSVAMLDAIYRAAGYRVGMYTSPHMLRYNERIRIDGEEISDDALCAAFARVDGARGSIQLTYFEFGTLAALDLFTRATLDVAVLEVGLGGRLDAVNIVDADCSLVTSIDIDHTEWLGNTRETIGFEKAGIFRAGKPAVCGDKNPPDSLIKHAHDIGSPLWCAQRDFAYRRDDSAWHWSTGETQRSALPYPRLRGAYQLDNAAAVLMVTQLLNATLPVAQAHLRQGLSTVEITGRFQVLPSRRTIVLDVAHNPHGARALAQALREQPCRGRTLAVFAMLNDKDITGVGVALNKVIDVWHCAGLSGARGTSALHVLAALESVPVQGLVYTHATVEAALTAATEDAREDDRIVVFGSFHTVAEALQSDILASLSAQ